MYPKIILTHQVFLEIQNFEKIKKEYE